MAKRLIDKLHGLVHLSFRDKMDPDYTHCEIVRGYFEKRFDSHELKPTLRRTNCIACIASEARR